MTLDELLKICALAMNNGVVNGNETLTFFDGEYEHTLKSITFTSLGVALSYAEQSTTEMLDDLMCRIAEIKYAGDSDMQRAFIAGWRAAQS